MGFEVTSNDNDYSAKFDQMYKFYNQLLTDVLSYRTPTGVSFETEQSAEIKSLNRSITNIFVSFLENDLIDLFNFNLISLLLDDFESVVKRLRNNKYSPLIDTFYEEIIVAQKNILNQLNINYSSARTKLKEKKLDESIKDVAELKEQIKNQETHDIYALAAKENQKRSDDFRVAFILLIIVAIIFIWFCAITKSYFGLKDYDYWFFKGTLVLTSVTLITYFLKQSVKYQKIADQCRQTKMELEAFPSFVASFTTEDPKIIEIRRELALKYFGRELDSTTKDDTGGIIAEQMRSTTEMVKATTEAIKNLNTKSNGAD